MASPFSYYSWGQPPRRPRPRIAGTTSPVGQAAEVEFDPVRGLIVHGNYVSAGDNLGGIAGFCIANRIAFHWKISPIKSSISTTYSGGQLGFSDFPQANWQLLGNEDQKSIFESGMALEGKRMFPQLFAHVKQGVSLLQGGLIAEEFDLQENDLEDGEFHYYAYLVYKLTAGQTHWQKGQFVLRRTISISNFFNGALADEGNMETLIPMQDILNYGMPPVMVARLASIPIPEGHEVNLGGEENILYAWGWRQLPSQMVTAAQNRVDVSTEWWWDEWDTTLYPLPSF